MSGGQSKRPGGDGPRELVDLTRAECLTLLADNAFGRVVVATAQSRTPIIRPVHYRFDPASQSVVFRTAGGSKLHALVHGPRASFEIDGSSPDGGLGWSVIISGNVEPITHPSEVAQLTRLGFDTWPDGSRPHWIRIRARKVSGRRLVAVAEASVNGRTCALPTGLD